MRFLVIAEPNGNIVPPELLPALLAEEQEWRQRYRDRLDAYDWFAAGGGFGILDTDDEVVLCRAVAEHPFNPFTTTQVRPIVNADSASGQIREVVEARLTAAS
jgi:hypothetical protein